MHGVDLLRARTLDHLHQLVEVAMVGQVEGCVGAEQAREVRVLRPTGDQGRPVPAKPADVVLAHRRRDDDAVGDRLAIELDPVRQRAPGHRVLPCARHAAFFQGEREPVLREREHHLFGLAEGVAEQNRGHATVQRAPAPPGDELQGLVRVAKAEVRAAVGRLHDQDVGPRHRRLHATGLPELDVAGVEDRPAVVLEMQLRRAEHVSGRIERHRAVAAAQGLAESQHPPATRSAFGRNQGEGLGCEQRLLVPAGVIGVGVRYEREVADDERVEPEAVARQRDAVVPDDLAGHRRTTSPRANRSGGTTTPAPMYASRGTPMSATTTRPGRADKPGFGSPKAIVTSALTVGA